MAVLYHKGNRKPLKVPAGGWTQEDYATREGVRLVEELVRVRLEELIRAIRDADKFLRAHFTEEFNAFLEEATGEKFADYDRKGVPAQLKKWADALVRTIRRFEPKLIEGMSPRLYRSGRKILWDTAHLLGKKPSELDERLFRVSADKLAQRVTGVARTTRERMASAISQGVKEKLTVKQMVARLRKRFPALTLARVSTIARTEMSRAADLGQLAAYKADGRVTHVSVVGCQAIEPGIPEFEGVPTCNIRNVPVRHAGMLEFHINHTGTLIPSGFLTRAGNVPRLQLRRGKAACAHPRKEVSALAGP